MKCLVVDDHRLVAQAVGGLLSEVCNLELMVCCSVVEAIDAIRQRPPDLLLLDVVLPGERWQDASTTLQAFNPDGRLIFLTGAVELFTPPAELEAITLAVVEKSRSWEELVRVVSDWTCSQQIRWPHRAERMAMPPLERLSPRELRVFEALGRGMLNKEIARQLGLTPATVETYRKTICAMLGVSGAELVRAAVLHRCCRSGEPSNAEPISDDSAA